MKIALKNNKSLIYNDNGFITFAIGERPVASYRNISLQDFLIKLEQFINNI